MPKDELDPEDPNELVGMALPGGDADEEQMALCLVDEYVRLGFSRAQILQMFREPFYRMTHAIHRRRGERWVEQLVDRVLAQWSGGSSCPT